MGKWGQTIRDSAHVTARAGGGSEAAGKEALELFGLGCPPYICVQGIWPLAPSWCGTAFP